MWPVGYPTLISAVSWILGISTMLASKILNIFLLTLAILSLYFSLGRNGLIASLVLLTASTLRNYTMTWSEAPFLTFLIILCLLIGKIINDKSTISNKSLISLFFLLILPFLFRYVGLFVLIPTFLIALYLLFLKRKRDSFAILTIIFFAFIFCSIYLANNIQLTGHLTGMERVQASEGGYQLFNELVSAIFQEFILIMPNWNMVNLKQNIVVLIWFIFVLICGLLIFKNINLNATGKFISYTYIFMIFGSFYLISIIFLRWNASFESFGFRILNPGFALIFIGIIIWVLDKTEEKKLVMSILLFITVVLVATGNIYNLINKHGLKANYSIHINKMKKKYSLLPDNAVVIFGSRELKYIRPNIRIAYPKNKYGSTVKENWNKFLISLDRSSPIFIEIKSKNNHNTLSSSDNIIMSIKEYNKN